MPRAARRRYALLVVPDVPGAPARKPLVQAYGVAVGDGVFCAALFAAVSIPAQVLRALLVNRHEEPVEVWLDWSPVEPGVLHGRVSIDLAPPEEAA